jgi:hypothetical protein
MKPAMMCVLESMGQVIGYMSPARDRGRTKAVW